MALKIVAWNCRRALSKKLDILTRMNADVYIISEADDPARYAEKLTNYNFFYRVIPKGKNGLLIFCKKKFALRALQWENYYLNYFVPFRINDTKILGVWTKDNYIEDMVPFVASHLSDLTDFIIAGDFNSNYQWNAKHGVRSHATLNELMNRIDHVSLYHFLRHEKFGQEREPTFVMKRKNRNHFYHIDYCYVPQNLVANATIKIGETTDWLQYSDHLPLIIELR